MELCLYASVPDAVDLELEAEPGTIDYHLKGEVEVIEFDAACSCEPSEQGSRDGTEIRRQRAHVHEVAAVGHGRLVGVTRDQVVRHDEGLTGPEIACVVERNG